MYINRRKQIVKKLFSCNLEGTNLNTGLSLGLIKITLLNATLRK